MRNARLWLAITMWALCASTAQAQWQLNTEQSQLNFISIKNARVGESHYFRQLSGFITPEGRGQIDITMDSVETLIPIRNERMRDVLFKTAEHPMAKVRARMEPEVLASLLDGGVVNTRMQVALALRGVERMFDVPVTVVGEPGGRLTVLTRQPVLLSVDEFGLGGGVEALRALANLANISTVVPITASLVFDPVPAE